MRPESDLGCEDRRPVVSIWVWLILTLITLRTAGQPPCLSGEDKPAPAASAAKPIIEAEARGFADALTETILKGDYEQYIKLVDWQGIVNKASAAPKSDSLNEVRSRFRSPRESDQTFLKKYINRYRSLVKAGGSFKCVQSSVTAERPFLMFRAMGPSGQGLHYVKLLLVRDSKGEIVVDDMYLFETAELVSQTLRRGWMLIVKEEFNKTGEKLPAADDPTAGLESIVRMTLLKRMNKHAEVVEVYRGLSESAQSDKNVLQFTLTSAAKVSAAQYASIVNDYRRYHPDDVALDFLLIDGYRFWKQFDTALTCVERVIKQVGNDAMLLVKRAELQRQLKQLSNARKSVAAAIELEPDLFDPYAEGFFISLADQSFDETVKYLTILEKRFGYQASDLSAIPGYSAFMKSDQFREWEKGRKKD